MHRLQPSRRGCPGGFSRLTMLLLMQSQLAAQAQADADAVQAAPMR